MQHRESYYAMRTALRYYGGLPGQVELRNDGVTADADTLVDTPFDFRRWPDPPHVALANMRQDTPALRVFTCRYGVVSERKDTGVRFIALQDVLRFQDYLRQAWKGKAAVLDQMRVDVMVQLRTFASGTEIAISDLWTLVRLLFLRDRLTGRARVCKNADCPAPYFLAARKGQQFCSHKCAVLINVRRFRERQAKRPKKQDRRR